MNTRTILILCIMFVGNYLQAQIDSGLLLELTKATTAEMSVVTPQTGVLIYNTDDNKVYCFDGSNWIPTTRKFVDGSANNDAVYTTGNVGIGTDSPSTKLEVAGGAIKATGGLIIETRTDDPAAPADGQIWLRTDL